MNNPSIACAAVDQSVQRSWTEFTKLGINVWPEKNAQCIHSWRQLAVVEFLSWSWQRKSPLVFRSGRRLPLLIDVCRWAEYNKFFDQHGSNRILLSVKPAAVDGFWLQMTSLCLVRRWKLMWRLWLFSFQLAARFTSFECCSQVDDCVTCDVGVKETLKRRKLVRLTQVWHVHTSNPILGRRNRRPVFKVFPLFGVNARGFK